MYDILEISLEKGGKSMRKQKLGMGHFIGSLIVIFVVAYLKYLAIQEAEIAAQKTARYINHH